MRVSFTALRHTGTFLGFLFTINVNAQYQVINAFENLPKFSKPVEMTFPYDNTNKLFVVEQKGIIYAFDNNPNTNLRNAFLDLSSSVYFNNMETGLLGLAFHPQYVTNKYFYVNYTKRINDSLFTFVSRFSGNPTDPNIAVPTSEKVVLKYHQPYENHNGGCLRFGPDGYLYISSGDGGSSNDPEDNGQDLTTFLGKILRIDVNGTEINGAYSIPADNPFISTPNARKEIFAYGLRNPWKMEFDPVTKHLWAGDVGQSFREEIDIVESGKNYGWKVMEGFSCRGGASNCNTTGLALPVIDYAWGQNGNSSVTGGFVYRGTKIPELTGKYIYGDYISGRIYALDYKPGLDTSYVELFNGTFNISAFAYDQNQEIFVLDHGSGNILKLIKPVTTSIDVVDNAVGIKINSIHPNPVQNAFSITIHSKESQKASIKLLNNSGKLLGYLWESVLTSGRNVLSFDGGNLKSGIYFVEVATGNSKNTIKLVKE